MFQFPDSYEKGEVLQANLPSFSGAKTVATTLSCVALHWTTQAGTKIADLKEWAGLGT